jgi:hypothetical protein
VTGGPLALVLAAALAAPPQGVPAEPRRGFFTELALGAFFTLGGDDAYSDVQPSLQLGVGYELAFAQGRVLVPLGLQAALGSNARNCWAGRLSSGACSGADTFTLTLVEVAAGALFEVAERLYLGPRLLLGGTLLDPEPRPGLRFQFDLGLVATLEYGTALDHFSVGVDVIYRLVLGPGISAIAIQPHVKYTF